MKYVPLGIQRFYHTVVLLAFELTMPHLTFSFPQQQLCQRRIQETGCLDCALAIKKTSKRVIKNSREV